MAGKRKFRVGTRGSALALAQSKAWVHAWQQVHSGLEVEFQTIVTSGDRIQDRFLSEVGGKGLFVKEIESALLDGEIDLAVHSMKDLPAHNPEGLEILCIPERAAPWDVLIGRTGQSLEELPEGARIGTSSLRRRTQLKIKRPDLNFALLRGNIDTRLKKLAAGEFDGIILAQAGMERLGLDTRDARKLPLIPAPGQGTLAIQGRTEDGELKKALAPLDCETSASLANLERQVAAAFDGHCQLPLACFAQKQNEQVHLEVFLATPDGERHLEWRGSGPWSKREAVGQRAIKTLNAKGAQEILVACR